MNKNLIVTAFERAEKLLTRESEKHRAELRKQQNAALRAAKSGKFTMNSRREKAIKIRIGEVSCDITEINANVGDMSK